MIPEVDLERLLLQLREATKAETGYVIRDIRYIVTAALADLETRKQVRKANYITQKVSVSIAEIAACNEDSFTELLSRLATSHKDELFQDQGWLTDLSWKLISIDNLNPGSVIIQVTGNPTEAEIFFRDQND